MISPYKINWAGLSSLDLNLWTELSFDADSGQISTFLNRENIITEHYDGRRTIHRTRYQEVLTPTITFIKQNYEEFNSDENRKILSWLTSNEYPGYLEIFHDDSEAISYKLWGNWIGVEQYKLSNGRVVGYVAVFESSHPYAYSRNLTYPEVYDTIEEITNNDETNDYLHINKKGVFNITCNSDEYNKPLYPKVTVKFTGDNIYMATDKNPLDPNYTMIPRVIYSYTYVGYNEASVKDAFNKLSDEEKTELGINEKVFADLTKEEKNAIGVYAELSKVSITELYININTGDIEDQGKSQIIDVVQSKAEANGYTADGLYYFPSEQVIQKVIATTNNDGTTTYSWKIVSTVGAAVSINNTTIEKDTVVAGGALGETIIFDGANRVITSDKDTTVRIIGDDFNWVWPAFISGTNSFTVTGNCDIKFEWVEPRKVGSL